MASDRHVDFHTRRQMFAQDLNHLAHRQAFRRRLTGNIRHNELTVLGAVTAIRRNQNFHRNAFVVGL